MRNPAERQVVAEGTFGRNLRTAEAIITAGLDGADLGGRRPCALLRCGGDDFAVRACAQAVWIAEAGAENFLRATVAADPMRSEGVGVVEVPCVVLLQAGDVIVAAGRGLDEIAEAFVEVGFAVAVTIVQARDLIATEHEDFAIANLQAKRLKQAGRKSFPAERTELVVDAGHAPDIAVNRADVGGTVGGEVHAGDEEERVPWIGVGHGERVHGEDVRVETALSDGLQLGQPASRAGLGELGEVFWRSGIPEQRGEC